MLYLYRKQTWTERRPPSSKTWFFTPHSPESHSPISPTFSLNTFSNHQSKPSPTHTHTKMAETENSHVSHSMNHSSPCKILCLNVKKINKQTKTKIKVKSPYYGTVVTSETILLINYCINEAKNATWKAILILLHSFETKAKQKHTREGTKHIYHNPTHTFTNNRWKTTHSQQL